MGSKEQSNVAAECSIPAYCVKTLGSRHILVGGGGGSAKTGVLNQLQLFLLTYGSEFDAKIERYARSGHGQLIAQLGCTVDTGEFANMNMDCIVLGNNEPEKGLFLVAVGQDQFCTLYETTGFCINQETGSGALALEFRSLLRIETDKRGAGDDSYQKCVRLFRTQDQQLKMLTGGTDGYIRLWSISDLIEQFNREGGSEEAGNSNERRTKMSIRVDAAPEMEMHTGKSALEEMDVSPCGRLLAAVLPQSTSLWDLNEGGRRMLELPAEGGAEEILTKKFKVRALRFTALDRTGKFAVFVTAHNQRVRSSKEVSHLGLWSLTKATGECRLIQARKACKETISCLEISECGKFTAAGTMGGSIGLFDTQTLNSLMHFSQAHSSFVTALAFLPQKSYDVKDLGRIGEKEKPPGRCFLPGICANSRTAVVSISVDKRIMVHRLPFPSPSSLSGFLLRLSLLAALLYSLFWAIFVQHHHHQ